MDADRPPPLHARMRWGNVARAGALVALAAVIVAWPRLSPEPPALPPVRPVPAAPAPAVEGGGDVVDEPVPETREVPAEVAPTRPIERPARERRRARRTRPAPRARPPARAAPARAAPALRRPLPARPAPPPRPTRPKPAPHQETPAGGTPEFENEFG